MKKFFNKVFSKPVLTLFFFLLELAAVVTLLYFLQENFAFIRISFAILALIIAVFIVNSKMESSYKVCWLFLFILTPLFGSLAYVTFADKKITKREFKKIKPLLDNYDKATLAAKKDVLDEVLDKDKDPECYNISQYLKNVGGAMLFNHTETTYYDWGEKGFPVILEELKKAKEYIFIEYFIINEGHMWTQMLDILKEKANNGVDIRVLYDDLGSKDLPINYTKTLESFGIKACKYSPLRPLLDIRMNNRDHRKILVIDGKVGFSGGINISDEYINEKVRFGKWKDNVIRLEGPGVFSLTSYFLGNWYSCVGGDFASVSFEKYVKDAESASKPFVKGYVQPYATVPYIYETIGENVYINLLMKAKRYCYISTPYLILDDQMINAICLAAKNGVDVRIIMPGIPDKKVVFSIGRGHYQRFLEEGVRIFEYTPGFVHQKVFLVDDVMGTVGTINLDYRSLYLHCENGIFIYEAKCLNDIKEDFETMFRVSKEITLEEAKKTNIFRKVGRGLLKLISPLM